MEHPVYMKQLFHLITSYDHIPQQPGIDLYVHPTSLTRLRWRNAFLALSMHQSRMIHRKLITHLRLGPPAQLESQSMLKMNAHSYCVLSGTQSLY